MMTMRDEERAGLAGHPPAADEEDALAEVRRRHSSWTIDRSPDGRGFTATHRTEQPNPRLERAGWRTTVTADSPDELDRLLFLQQALRGDGHRTEEAE